MVIAASVGLSLLKVALQGAAVVGCNGTSRLLRNLVLRTTNPCIVTSLNSKCIASEMRNPVTASSPKSV